jgi:predicted enzyme related to lactoylglutathione lyase
MSIFEFSSYIDIKVSDPKAAAEFYAKNFGWALEKSDCHEHTLKFGPLTIFLTQSEGKTVRSNIHFEMACAGEIEAVKAGLEKAGCTYCKSGMKDAYMFTDPFGNNFHIYQKR